MRIFCFTASGNNLYLAKKIGGDLLSIPRVLKEKKGSLEYVDNCIGIIFPCHYFATPGIVKEFMERVTFRSDYVFAIMSYGNYN